MDNHASYRRFVISLAFSMIVIVQIACAAPTPTPTPVPPSDTEQHMEHAISLRSAIDSFEESRSSTSDKIVEISSKINEILDASSLNDISPASCCSDGTPVISDTGNYSITQINLSELALMWETDWNEVHTKFDLLSQNFSRIDSSSEEYFQELDTLVEAIVDEQLRNAERAKNLKLREDWNLAYLQAQTDLAALEQLISRGDDFEKILQLAALRATLSENIIQLREISREAQNLLAELGQLTVQGRKLILGQSS